MSFKPYQLNWQETKNGVSIECSLEVKVHNSNSNTILLLVPGVDGSVDGYENKYVTIAENILKKHGVAVVRMENPFVTSFHWESNIRQILNFIKDNSLEICGTNNYDLHIQAHSAGASVVASIAHEFPKIRKLLLINIAMSLSPNSIVEGLGKYEGDVTILMGDKDDSLEDVKKLGFSENSNTAQIVIATNTDHNFSGDSFPLFLNAANTYFYGDSK